MNLFVLTVLYNVAIIANFVDDGSFQEGHDLFSKVGSAMQANGDSNESHWS